jgi:hypothetical protein
MNANFNDMGSVPPDWFALVERYLQTGTWDGPGPVPMNPDTDVPADVRAHYGIKIDPGLALPRKANGRAPETNIEPEPPAQPKPPTMGAGEPRSSGCSGSAGVASVERSGFFADASTGAPSAEKSSGADGFGCAGAIGGRESSLSRRR